MEFPEFNKPIRTLSSGAEITDEKTIDHGDWVQFVFELEGTDFEKQFIQPVPVPGHENLAIDNPARRILDYLDELFNPNSDNHYIVDGLNKKGWLTKDGVIAKRFKWALSYDAKKKTVIFTYYTSTTPPNLGQGDYN